MDVIKQKKTPFYKNKKVLMGAGVLVLATIGVASSMMKLTLHSVDANTFRTATVQRGDLKIKVSAPGILAPRDVRWVASSVEGKVERILVKPGAKVTEGDLIVELLNPELTQQVQELRWELEAMEAGTRALKERQDTRLLDMEAQVLTNQMEYNKEKIRLDAEAKLIEGGNSTISKLDYESRRLTVAQMEKTLEMDTARSQQLKTTLKAEYEAQIALLNRLRNRLKRAEFQLASLNVKAPVSGVLQAMPLELGQRISLGDSVAKFSRQGDLLAELNVPEFSVNDISIGQRVSIDTRFSQIDGRVIRIDPAVVDGTVQVDVELLSELPSESRPDLSIDGEIFITERTSTLYVRRPTFSQANQKMRVFKLDSERSYAEQTEVHFGVSSSVNIEVLGGVTEGDVIIVSEVSNFERHKKVAIN
ncbi:efflux RND transporter periplasmic adaptor subunit [Pleionea sp. CnH1-48]|uniref:efflux RND transporter periplasmic adaptor subunit n=1 Tax=Pleionea sp. CnH1-48 TaxID=2954494 RepID=UPI002096E146|nr:efflux RND transporter periplasmic adaptor subunit [Pleionea sp. CnH1-48]MCO7226514.1 efflux RND transporter periplasmic adaptor subunit [Pleionea sp. CnH1-48]